MAFQAVPDTAEVDIRYVLFGQLIENTLYFVLTGEIDADRLSELTAAVGLWVVTELLPHLSSNLIVNEVFAKDLSAPGGAEFHDTSHTGAVGGTATTPLPGGLALAVAFKTGLAGRSNRGRNFIGGILEAGVSGNQLTSTYAEQLRNAYEQLPTYTEPIGATHSVVSRVLDGVVRTVGVATSVLSYVLADLNIDSQRRRLTGRGN